MALGKVGELRHLQGDLPAAAALYAQALALRRALLAATRAQWPAAETKGARQAAGGGGGAAAAAADAAAGEPGADADEGAEARCSASLDLAASCLKLAGAQLGLGAEAEAQVRGEAGGWARRCILHACFGGQVSSASDVQRTPQPCFHRTRYAQALLEEAAQLLAGQAAGLHRQPPRLQRKHAALAQFAAALRQPADVPGEQ